MNSPYTTANVAAGLIRRGISRLADQYPFHARVLEKLMLVPRQEVPTLGVMPADRSISLLYNPEFVRSLSSEVLGGVLLHEVHHVVFGHLGLNPTDFNDSWAFNVACEVTANEFVREPLPSGVITLGAFPELPPMESTIDRYHRLRNQKKRLTLNYARADANGSNGRASGVMVDDHSHWREISDDSKQAIAELVLEAVVECGGVPEELKEAVKSTGSAAGGLVYLLDQAKAGVINWHQALRRYVGQILEPRPTFAQPPRRFPNLIGIFPGAQRSPKRPFIIAIIDTSGSITDDLLEQIDAELAAMSRAYTVYVVECDCKIQAHYKYKTRISNVKGRGGTDFRKPLAPEFLRPLKPDLIVYFTDGEGPAPENKPPYPLIWCLVPGGKPPADYGRVIRIDHADSDDR